MMKLLRHLFVDDFLLKLFSLALALLFWITVSFAIQQKEAFPPPALTPTTEVRTFSNLPVMVISSASDVHNFKVSPSQVEVTVQGDEREIRTLESKDVRALVDLTGTEAARSLLKRVEVSVPPGVTLVSITPEEVQVNPPPKPLVR
jgi:YbbR domain-containing protein